VKQDGTVFQHASGTDALAAKGVVYARVLLPGHSIAHVFGTHLQCDRQAVRMGQLKEIQAFAQSMVQDAEHGLMVLAGDINMDYWEHRTMLRRMFGWTGPAQLNQSFYQDIKSHCTENQFCDMTPLFSSKIGPCPSKRCGAIDHILTRCLGSTILSDLTWHVAKPPVSTGCDRVLGRPYHHKTVPIKSLSDHPIVVGCIYFYTENRIILKSI
jgi:hypothetical protein